MTTDSSTAPKPYDVYHHLEDPTGVLSVNLAIWETRDDSKPQTAVRESANNAVDSIDSMLSSLYRMRERLLGEIRESETRPQPGSM
jgi:hypothetical protein